MIEILLLLLFLHTAIHTNIPYIVHISPITKIDSISNNISIYIHSFYVISNNIILTNNMNITI